MRKRTFIYLRIQLYPRARKHKTRKRTRSTDGFVIHYSLLLFEMTRADQLSPPGLRTQDTKRLVEKL